MMLRFLRESPTGAGAARVIHASAVYTRYVHICMCYEDVHVAEELTPYFLCVHIQVRMSRFVAADPPSC